MRRLVCLALVLLALPLAIGADPAPQAPPPGYPPGMEAVEVSLKTSEGTVPLGFQRGTMSSAGFGPFGAVFVNYPDLRARVRTQEKRPTLLVKAASIGGKRQFLIKLDPDTDDDVRSLKIAGGRKGMAPDADSIIPVDSTEESRGLWRVTPREDLAPGEYGWFLDPSAGFQGMGLFDFAVE